MFDKILATNIFEKTIIAKGKGSWVWDVKGKNYLDLTSGMWCLNLGHNHPKIVQNLKNQMDKLIHKNTRFLTSETLGASEKLLGFIPGNFDKLTFLNSGSEAIEFGISFAQKVTKREKVMSLADSYLGAYGLGRQSSYTSEKSKLKISYPICDDFECQCLKEYDPLLRDIEKESKSIACFILEPIMVSGGIYKPCTSFVNVLAHLIQENGGLVAIDEVTTGFGRTGKKFGFQHYNIQPDIIVLGKALGNGYPVSAIVTRAELETKIEPDKRYYAQSHQLDPLGAVAVQTVVDIFEKKKIIEICQEKIADLSRFFKSLEHPCIKEVRNYGMIFGIEIQNYKNTKKLQMLTEIKDSLLEKGIAIGLSLGKNLLRILPPLTITELEIEFLKDQITKVFKELE